MNSILANRERLVLEKYIIAEDVRLEKRAMQDIRSRSKIETRIKLVQNTNKLNDLEQQVLEAWRQRENHSIKRAKKKEVEKAMDKYLLQLRLKKEIRRQGAKLIKSDALEGPKMEPLPYLKKFRKKFNKSMQETSTYREYEDEYRDEPSVQMYLHNRKGIQLKAVNNSVARNPSKDSELSYRLSPESKPKNQKGAKVKLKYPIIA